MMVESELPSLADVERRLREALHRAAAPIDPEDRLDEILARDPALPVRSGAPGARWLLPLAAAAAATVIGLVLWTAGPEPAPPATPTPTGATTPSSNPTEPTREPGPAPSSPTARPTGSATGAPAGTVQVALPAYFVGMTDDGDGYGLYREFIRADVPDGGSDRARARAAVSLALNAQPFSNTAGYLQPWSGTRALDVTVTPLLITVGLSGPGAPGFEAEAERLAVQSLVWTVQGAVGKGPIPVTFAVAGADRIFGRFPAGDTYNRPPSDESWRDLAAVWISAPGRDQVLSAAKAVRVTGEASVFEATVNWSVSRGTAEVKGGTTMASLGAPGRGEWSVDLGRLTAGTYTVSAWWTSPKDGRELDRVAVTFSVR